MIIVTCQKWLRWSIHLRKRLKRHPELRLWLSLLMSLKSKFFTYCKALTTFYSLNRQKHGVKHGVFQMPTTTALGDTNKYPKTTHARDPDTGKPVTELKNFYTTKIKKGKNDEVYIGRDKKDFRNKMSDAAKEMNPPKPSYVATGCLYD